MVLGLPGSQLYDSNPGSLENPGSNRDPNSPRKPWLQPGLWQDPCHRAGSLVAPKDLVLAGVPGAARLSAAEL